ncbi:MAG: response regulator transcription factor [Candidatus Obscuribacterales bacterium]|nr:response regulator transcription factor [Cyanobacteria bacterium SZAS LIN-5]RTL41491.1 MAG: response regulator transcription factor [Candidatus Melainabacteria bacterium]
MTKILIVEDDADLGATLGRWMKLENYVFDLKDNGQDALQDLRFNNYDAIVLDLRLPDISGLEVLRTFRSRGGKTPVLILTGKNMIDEKTAGLDAGADDYLTKPFDGRELMARLRALLRRPAGFAGDVLVAGDIELDRKSHVVKCGGNEISLLPKEFDLLEFFMRHPNQVFNTESLLERVWPSTSETSPEVVRTHMNRLRKKLTAQGQREWFETVHGVGYKLKV